MKLSKFSIRVLTALLTLSVMGWGPLATAQNDSPAMSSREFRASLTPNERKLPRDVLAQQRLRGLSGLEHVWMALLRLVFPMLKSPPRKNQCYHV